MTDGNKEVITREDFEKESLDLGFGIKLSHGFMVHPDGTQFFKMSELVETSLETSFTESKYSPNNLNSIVGGLNVTTRQQQSLRFRFCAAVQVTREEDGVEQNFNYFGHACAKNKDLSERRDEIAKALATIQRNFVLAALNDGKQGISQDLFENVDSALLEPMHFKSEGREDGINVVLTRVQSPS